MIKNDAKLHDSRKIEAVRRILLEKLKNYNGKKPILIDEIDLELLKRIIFNLTETDREVKYDMLPSFKSVYCKIDFSNISFDGVNVMGVDFTEWFGVKINPQTVYKKSMCYTTLTNVKIIGPFDGVLVEGMNTTGSTGVEINPQTVWDKDMFKTILRDSKIIGSFEDAFIECMNTAGSVGAIINPQTIKDKIMIGAVLANALIIGPLDGVIIAHADFKGSVGALVNPQTVYDKNISFANLADAQVINNFTGVRKEGVELKDSVIIDTKNPVLKRKLKIFTPRIKKQ